MIRLNPTGRALIALALLALIAISADALLFKARHVAWVQSKLSRQPNPMATSSLTALDFPAGSSAPVGDLLSPLPDRPIRVAALAQASAASLLVAGGGIAPRRDAPISRGYNLPLETRLYSDEASLARALHDGGEGEQDGLGVDGALVTVDRLAALRAAYPKLRLKAVLLVSRSRGGQGIVATPDLNEPLDLVGRRVAVALRTADRYFLLWRLTRDGIPLGSIGLVPATSSADAARLFREQRVDAAAGSIAELSPVMAERDGHVIASTADSPHLVATVLAVREEFLIHFPDAVRRLARALLDAGEAIGKNPTEASRLLAAHAPTIEDPLLALHGEPFASVTDNLAFFNIKGDTPVQFDELYSSATALWRKLNEKTDPRPASEARDLGAISAIRVVPPPPVPRPVRIAEKPASSEGSDSSDALEAPEPREAGEATSAGATPEAPAPRTPNATVPPKH